MLAQKRKSKLALVQPSQITQGILCTKKLIEKYKGAKVTPDLVARIAFEAFVIGRLTESTNPLDESVFDSLLG